jgi:hypothetical protein
MLKRLRPLLPVEEPRDLGHLVPLQAAQLAFDLPHQLKYIPVIFCNQELPETSFAKESNINVSSVKIKVKLRNLGTTSYPQE